jgi:hypothetical protein
MSKTVDRKAANHIVGRVLGVKEGDDKIEAAQKAIDMAKLAGFPKRQIDKMERMLEDYKARSLA